MADREKLIELQEKWFSCDDHEDLEKFADFMIANGVTAQRHGKWKMRTDEDGFWYYCSKCGQNALFDIFNYQEKSDYCPNCGAKMDGEKNEIL